MRVARLIEAINLSVTKRQFAHQLVYKLMTAVNRVSRSHNWSWLRREFEFQTQPLFTSAATDWQISEGDDVLSSSAGDIEREYTGAEIIITSDNGTSRHKILRIGDRDDQTFAINNIYLDGRSKVDHTSNVTVSVFRRAYCPISGIVELGLVAENVTGDLRVKGENDPLTMVDRIEFLRRYADVTVAGAGSPRYYYVGDNAEVPAPKFAPVVTGTNTSGTKTPPAAGGTVFLACAYTDDRGFVKSQIGPITEYTLPPSSAAGFQIEVEYGNESGVPEESHRLALLVSPINPTGFDGEVPADKDFRRNESMIPFFFWDNHPFDTTTWGAGTKGGGQFEDVPMTDEEILVHPRWWPAAESTTIVFTDIPSSKEDYTITGKARHPWMAWVDDNCLLPDEFHDALELAVRASIQGQEGLLAERRFQFTLMQLRKKDQRKAASTNPDPIRYGQEYRYVDRYDLE